MEELAVLPKGLKIDFSVSERPPCLQIEDSGLMEVISVTAFELGTRGEKKKGRVVVSVGRDPLKDDLERFYESQDLCVSIFDSRILLEAGLKDDGSLEFEFNPQRTTKEAALKEVFKVLKIGDYWNAGKREET